MICGTSSFWPNVPDREGASAQWRYIAWRTTRIPGRRAGMREIAIHSTPPHPNQALVHVRRAGVAFGDLLWPESFLRHFLPSPWIPGYDLCGEIVSIGPRSGLRTVRNFRVGQRVCALAMRGAYSQYIELPLSRLLAVPENLNDDAACALVLNYLSAWQMMFRVAKLKSTLGSTLGSNERPIILLHSAAGGVGTALLQLAHWAGIRAYGTASRKKLVLVESLGGIAIDKREDIHRIIGQREPQGLDAIFDSRGPESARRGRSLLKRGGRIVLFGMLADHEGLKNLPRLCLNTLRFLLPLQRGKAFIYAINPGKHWYRQDLGRILKLASMGKLNPLIHKVLPLEQANMAWELLRSGEVSGKLLLNPHPHLP